MRVLAHAKLTVSLRITGVREDGYHLIDAEMVSVGLADRLDIAPLGDHQQRSARGSVVTYTGPYAIEVDPAADLVRRALAAAQRGARVIVDKRIPAGGGLGGGSSDAAAILRWAGIDDPAVAVGIGADVPFCVVGGRARVQGIGELVEPLAFEERSYTLALPPFRCSTPAVYREWDRMGGPTGERGNDLEPAAMVVEPRLLEWRDRLEQHCAVPARLAGSGSTLLADGAHPGGGFVVVRTIGGPGGPKGA